MGRTNTERVKEIYGNYIIMSPSGKFMFRGTEKKANWYLSRNLAILTSADPPTIQLTFQPKGEGNDGDLYYLSEKKNKCVVCGDEDLATLTRHHIVPIDYRKFFSLEEKARNSHDIVAICRDCHDDYEQQYALELRSEIAIKYDAPIAAKEVLYPELGAIKLAYCLITRKIPENKRRVMKSRIRESLGIKRVSQKKLEELSQKDIKIERKKYPTHAEIVVPKLESVQEFVEMWRLHFVKSMKPNFMPKYWNVKRTIYRKK